MTLEEPEDIDHETDPALEELVAELEHWRHPGLYAAFLKAFRKARRIKSDGEDGYVRILFRHGKVTGVDEQSGISIKDVA